jgi:hypothetical protein
LLLLIHRVVWCYSAAPVKDLQKLVQDQSTRHPIRLLPRASDLCPHPACAGVADLFEGAAGRLVVVQDGDIRSSIREVLRTAAAKGKSLRPRHLMTVWLFWPLFRRL